MVWSAFGSVHNALLSVGVWVGMAAAVIWSWLTHPDGLPWIGFLNLCMVVAVVIAAVRVARRRPEAAVDLIGTLVVLVILGVTEDGALTRLGGPLSWLPWGQ